MCRNACRLNKVLHRTNILHNVAVDINACATAEELAREYPEQALVDFAIMYCNITDVTVSDSEVETAAKIIEHFECNPVRY